MTLFACVGSSAIMTIGIVTLYYLSKAHSTIKGDLKTLIFWLYSAVAFCGLPYSIWVFVTECGFLPVEGFIKQLPGMVFVSMFFIFMLMASIEAKKIGDKYK